MNPPPEIQIADNIALPHIPPLITGRRETVFPLVNPSTYAPARSNTVAGIIESNNWIGVRYEMACTRG